MSQLVMGLDLVATASKVAVAESEAIFHFRRDLW